MGEYVYGVYQAIYDLRLARAEVVKRTPRQLTIKADGSNGAAFGWRSRVSPDDYADSPERAVARYRDRLEAKIAHMETSLSVLRRALVESPAPTWDTPSEAKRAATTAASDVAPKESV